MTTQYNPLCRREFLVRGTAATVCLGALAAARSTEREPKPERPDLVLPQRRNPHQRDRQAGRKTAHDWLLGLQAVVVEDGREARVLPPIQRRPRHRQLAEPPPASSTSTAPASISCANPRSPTSIPPGRVTATNTPIWNRKNPKTGSFFVMQSKIGGKPGDEVALTDAGLSTPGSTQVLPMAGCSSRATTRRRAGATT